MPDKTLRDVIFEQLNTPEHQALHDNAEKLNELADSLREQQSQHSKSEKE